jgi:hypothetical protein
VAGIRQVVGAIGALALLAACGGGGSDSSDSGDSAFAKESAANIQKASVDDMKTLDSLHMNGSITQQAGEIGLDLSLTTEGDCSGTISRGDTGNAEVVSLDGTSWFRPDEEFWRAQAGAAADQIISTVGDDWVQLPEGDESFASFCDLKALLKQIEDDDDQEPSEKGATEDVDGQEAITLTRDNKEGGGTTTVWVAVDDPHHILKVEREGGESPSSVSFSEFGEDVSIEAPGAEEVITIEELQQQTQP